MAQAHPKESVEACSTLVPNYSSAVGDRQKQNAVLSGTCAQFTQNSAMKNHLLSSGNKLLAEANLLDPVWGVGLQTDNPRTNHPCQWSKTIFSVRNVLPFAKQFATMRPGRRTRCPQVGSASALRMNEDLNPVRAAAGPLTASSASKGRSSEVLTNVSDALAD